MSEPLRVLVVCTGNICRSAATAHLLRVHARDLAGEDGWLEVDSAGTAPALGEPVHPLTAQALDALDRGVPVAHRARELTREDLAKADLVLTATRDHRAAAARLHPAAVARLYTIREFARLAGEATSGDGEGLLDYDVTRRPRAVVAEARALRGLVRPVEPDADDLADPIADGPAEHLAMVEQADAAARAIIESFAGERVRAE